ncbi:MAG: hypothetical protein JWM74_3225 [Myxococcaceae bacterium]|nr:hypothetical protein [Myxococcaceae bacterium]
MCLLSWASSFASIALTLLACSSPASSTGVEVAPTTSPDAGLTDAVSDAPREASNASNATLTGFTARGASFALSRTTDNQALLDIVIADTPDLCGTPRGAPFAKVLHLTLRAQGPMTTGAFPVAAHETVMGGSGPAPEATVVVWTVYDVGGDLCSLSNGNEDQTTTGGTITLTRVSDDVVEGSLALTAKSPATPIAGSFRATSCSAARKETFACPLAL